METALRAIVPKIIGDVSFEIYTFLCKDDLLNKLPTRLQGYATYLSDDWRVMVIADQDDDDCRDLKRRMESAASWRG